MNKWLFIGVSLLALLMAAMLGFGYSRGDGWDEVARLVRMPWGAATFVDVYVGLVLFCGWVLSRERTRTRGWAWAGAVLLGGNLAACVYVLVALGHSKGDAQIFWRGRPA